MNPSSTLEAMLAQYEKNSKPTYTKRENAVAYDPKNYFGTYLEKTEKTKTKRVRILPTLDGSSPMVEMHGHKAQVEGEWKTFACLQEEAGTDCPFCEARQALLASKTDTDKELAKAYSTKKMYVAKVIDRDNEADGVKFWRFNHDYRSTGIYDKIFGILKLAGNITSKDTGRDLQIVINRDQNNRPAVASINQFDASPLSADETVADEWVNDTKTWKDVYPMKSYEYLEIIVKGGVPTWDKELKKFVDKALAKEATPAEKLDTELSMGVNPSAPLATPTLEAAVAPTVQTVTEDLDDDLPF